MENAVFNGPQIGRDASHRTGRLMLVGTDTSNLPSKSFVPPILKKIKLYTVYQKSRFAQDFRFLFRRYLTSMRHVLHRKQEVKP